MKPCRYYKEYTEITENNLITGSRNPSMPDVDRRKICKHPAWQPTLGHANVTCQGDQDACKFNLFQ